MSMFFFNRIWLAFFEFTFVSAAQIGSLREYLPFSIGQVEKTKRTVGSNLPSTPIGNNYKSKTGAIFLKFNNSVIYSLSPLYRTKPKKYKI